MTTTRQYKSLTARQFDALHHLAMVHSGRGQESRRSKGFLTPRRDVYERLEDLGLAKQISATGYRITDKGLAVINGA
jgi:hypothetical protein